MTSNFLRGSANYVWITTSVLGKGATGSVFQGVNKNNGDPVAVKTFNQLSLMRHPDVQVREFEVIQKVNHENIVKLLAIEEERDTRGKVIVMELCTGGSLFTILDDPENSYGLHEEEFLLVLEHLTAGMKHLRDNNLVHRDLKPGNIMKFIADDGRTIYKLTDFGAARELEDDQQFLSLYGTEEYLHPDLYERAVLRKPVGKAFGASVDLWSIGVTLYHVATGNLPFRPFGGRRNKETMYFITTKKASGVISGTQLKESGQIEWSRELPVHCRLSVGLKRLITPLLAGLLEANTDRIWSFDRFFLEVQEILSRKIMHVFHLNRAQSIRIYLHPDGTYEEFQSLVRDQTEVAPVSQILLLKDAHFLSLVDETAHGRSYPKTDESSPVMLLSKENNNVCLAPEPDLAEFPVFPNLVQVENDASVAKVTCSVGHQCKRRIEKLALTSRLNHDCVKAFSSVINKHLESLLNKLDRLKELTEGIESLVECVTQDRVTISNLLKVVGQDCDVKNVDWESQLNSLQQDLMREVNQAIQQLHKRYVVDETLKCEWDNATHDLPCPAERRMPFKARTLVERLRESWQHLLRDRANRTLSYNDEQFHVLEKIKITETARQLSALLDQDATPAVVQQVECMADWYKMAQTVYVQAHILEKDLMEYDERQALLAESIIQDSREFHKELAIKLLEKKVQGEEAKHKPLSRKPLPTQEEAKNFCKSLKDLHFVTKDIQSIIQTNSSLVNQFEQLTKSLVSDNAV